jgi:hypothetical protein
MAQQKLVPWPAHDQRAQQGGEDEPDNPGNEEMGQWDFFAAFAGTALPFSGGHEGFDGFEAGAGVHGMVVAGTIISGNPASWQHFSNRVGFRFGTLVMFPACLRLPAHHFPISCGNKQ